MPRWPRTTRAASRLMQTNKAPPRRWSGRGHGPRRRDSMSNSKRSAALQGIEVREDAKGRKRYRGTARDKNADRHLRGPWTGSLAEARSWRVDAQARIQAGTLSAVAGPTVAEAAEQFIADMKVGHVPAEGRAHLQAEHRPGIRARSDQVRPARAGVEADQSSTAPRASTLGRCVDDAGEITVHDQEYRRRTAGFDRLRGTARVGPCESLQRTSTSCRTEGAGPNRLPRRSGGADSSDASQGSGNAWPRRLRRSATR